MEQFEIKRIIPLELFGWDISFTNASLFMVLAVVLIPLFYLFAMNRRALVPGRLQSIAELSYEFIANMIKDLVGEKGMKYFPWVFTIFMFVLALNLLGMLPYSFTVTSHIIVTFALAAMVWIGVTAIGFANHGPKFLKLFVPSGVPFWLLPVIVIIEVISYLIRPISHSVRLFANMMAGHAMFKVFAGFVVGMGLLGGWAPLVFLVGFTGFEIVVAFLQAFIFTVLTCIYLNDAVNMHEH
ncbi:F0F1 ATP synthase subunit A [Hyphomicrobium sp. D-2]|uniref:F0F1 ATP synthase subunit A n=1 Tax=Hyphomicrobium sp. D-2 TaxID=3041621 RepID=UPI0024539256|nr:F0F1 ATP synthase subunit A [Hyphomicrobium sp. D-2]MDH4982461.1 F0F1 ATP synthase subunit A [Hyphomicrobium sp. D-2]